MPEPLDTYDSSAASELAQAAGAALGISFFTPLGPKMLNALGRGAWGTAKATARFGYHLGTGTFQALARHPNIPAGAAGFGAGFAYGTGRAIGQLGWGLARTAGVGLADTAVRGGRFLWNHPYMGVAAGGALGLGMAATYSPPPANRISSPGMVDAMGGPGGVSGLMAQMRATGDVTLGLHAKR